MYSVISLMVLYFQVYHPNVSAKISASSRLKVLHLLNFLLDRNYLPGCTSLRYMHLSTTPGAVFRAGGSRLPPALCLLRSPGSTSRSSLSFQFLRLNQ